MTTSGQPHTGSYYAATVNDQTEFPSLAGDRSADVCIIGAGFTGISSALHLAERYGAGEDGVLRNSQKQNTLILDIPEKYVDELCNELNKQYRQDKGS